MNLEQFKTFISQSADNIRNIDSIPDDLSPEEKLIELSARKKVYGILTVILEISEGKKVGKDKRDKHYWLPK